MTYRLTPCATRKDGTASKSEPNRKSDGRAVGKDGARSALVS